MSGGARSAGVLDTILARTRESVEREKALRPLAAWDTELAKAPAVRPFASALARPDAISVIAEHKRRSPSKGAIREDLEPADVARGYAAGGAAALSILTDEPFFGGRLSHLTQARTATSLPVLRKDFIVDPWQIREARAAGADAVLLIVAALEDGALAELLGEARGVGLDALVEVHERAELERALAAGARLVGVNNRDLRTMTVSLETSLALVGAIPDDVVAVAESGIRCGLDLKRLRDAGFDACLVGERLMSAPDPGEALRLLLEEAA